MIIKPLNEWTREELIEEVRRLRKINKGNLETILSLQGIKGKVTTREIDDVLKQK